MVVKSKTGVLRRGMWMGVLLSMLIPSVQAQPASWPDKPIKLVVPFPAGGPTDTASRIVGQRLAERLKQPVVVENQIGRAHV